MASPFAVRLGVDRVEEAGRVAGRMYALSTTGSILGTFLPVVLLIPFIGTRRTMLASAGLLALVAAPALGRRYLLVPALIGAVALAPPGAIKPQPGVLFEGDSAYQFVEVRKLAGGCRALYLNEGWARHSVWCPHRVLTGDYWDQFLLAPVLHGPGLNSLAMIGYAGGTVGRAYGVFWPRVRIQGIELDPLVTSVGRRYLGLASNPRVSVATDDGRVYLETHSTRYDAIFVDAFRQPYIPFQLTTQEFWSLVAPATASGRARDGEPGPDPVRRSIWRGRSRAPRPRASRRSICGRRCRSTTSCWPSPSRRRLRPCAPGWPTCRRSSCRPPCTLPAFIRWRRPPTHSPTTGRRSSG